MTRTLLLTCLVASLAAGCGKKKSPPPLPPASSGSEGASAAPAKEAPAGLPQEFVQLVESKWPQIEREGQAFEKNFEEASSARKSGDREALSTAIAAASEHHRAFGDMWAEIAYWHVNALDDGEISESVKSLCDSHIRSYERQITAWNKKAKGLKELSTAK